MEWENDRQRKRKQTLREWGASDECSPGKGHRYVISEPSQSPTSHLSNVSNSYTCFRTPSHVSFYVQLSLIRPASGASTSLPGSSTPDPFSVLYLFTWGRGLCAWLCLPKDGQELRSHGSQDCLARNWPRGRVRELLMNEQITE